MFLPWFHEHPLARESVTAQCSTQCVKKVCLGSTALSGGKTKNLEEENPLFTIRRPPFFKIYLRLDPKINTNIQGPKQQHQCSESVCLCVIVFSEWFIFCCWCWMNEKKNIIRKELRRSKKNQKFSQAKLIVWSTPSCGSRVKYHRHYVCETSHYLFGYKKSFS